MKKNWKKLSLVLAMILCTAFVFAACGGGSSAPATEATADAAEAVTEAAEAAEAASEAAADVTEAAADAAEEAAAAVEPAADAKVLTLSIGNPEGSDNWHKYKKFADALAEVSGGKLVAEIYASGTLATDKEALNALMGGTVDCAHIIPSAASGTIKDISFMDLPGTFSYKDATDTQSFIDFDAAIHETLDEIFNSYGLHFIALNAPCQAVIATTYGTVKTPADCANQPFRTAGRWLGTLFEQWGASATTLDMSELTTGFERGTITGTLTAYGVIGSNKIYEVAPYLTYFNTTNNVAMFAMSGKVWDSLTDEEKGWVDEAGKAFLTGGQEVAQEYYQKYREEFEGADGVEIYDLTADEEAAFFSDLQPIYDAIKAECTENGIKLIDQINEFNGR